MEIYTEATSNATRDALKRLGDELSPPGDSDTGEPGDPCPEGHRDAAVDPGQKED